MKERTIEWKCPDTVDPDLIVQSLVEEYTEVKRSLGIPLDPQPYIIGGHTAAYGLFHKGSHYHLGILEERGWHGKNIHIKGFFPHKPNNPCFTLIISLLARSERLRVCDSA